MIPRFMAGILSFYRKTRIDQWSRTLDSHLFTQKEFML
jgi:hypothetical protein